MCNCLVKNIFVPYSNKRVNKMYLRIIIKKYIQNEFRKYTFYFFS